MNPDFIQSLSCFVFKKPNLFLMESMMQSSNLFFLLFSGSNSIRLM